jgi:cytochrome d ubiquinol oxidase subunit I
MSAFWILVLNSWMQTPVGFEMINGKAHATDWLAILFNPSFPYRFTHMMLASGLTVAFLVAGISAYRWVRGDRVPAVMAAMKTGVYLAAILIPLQIFAGDMHGLNTLKHQPAKVAAMEGLWDTERGVPLLLFAIPDEKTRTNKFEVGIPKVASLILTHDADGEIKGLNDFVGKHPPVLQVFWAFRIMVGAGMLIVAGCVAVKTHWRDTPMADACTYRHEFLRLGRDRRRVVCDRDRSPAVSRLRRFADGGCRVECERRHDRRDFSHVPHHVCVVNDLVHLGGVLSRAQSR